MDPMHESNQEREALVHQMYHFSLDEAPDAVFWMNKDAGFFYVNEQACRSLAYSREELLRLHLWDIDPVYAKARWERNWEQYETGEIGTQQLESCHQRKDGSVFPVEVSSKHIHLDGHEFHVAFVRDITERKRAMAETAKLESQLRQAQKMEAIGQLAGGVAHDFNNILTTILGHVELTTGALDEVLNSGDPVFDGLREIERGAQRAASLTSQLLAFSRKQVSQPRVLDLNRTLQEMEKMLRRLVTEDMVMTANLAPNLHRVYADASQIEQVLLNLVINARDAMADGGKLGLATANVTLDEAYCQTNPEATPGDYVRLTVSDTGCGMDAETARRAFEPFFTTKPAHKGTGLGLSTVYGIVKQALGHVSVHSEPGRGSTILVFLPAVETEATAPPKEHGASDDLGGTEKILLCEDEEGVRELTERMLRNAGYTVLAAQDGAAAKALAARHGSTFDMLLTDVILPDTNGRRLSEELAARIPGLCTLFVSGYTSDVIAHHGVLDSGVEFLEKPFTRTQLLTRVREVLDARPPARGA